MHIFSIFTQNYQDELWKKISEDFQPFDYIKIQQGQATSFPTNAQAKILRETFSAVFVTCWKNSLFFQKNN